MTPDLNQLTDDQLEQLVALLARFAAWLDHREACPTAPPFISVAQSERCRDDYTDTALDYLATAQAIRELAETRPRLFSPDD